MGKHRDYSVRHNQDCQRPDGLTGQELGLTCQAKPPICLAGPRPLNAPEPLEMHATNSLKARLSARTEGSKLPHHACVMALSC
ncbi:hypothetical protein EMCRGX_G013868 [Ephydatia muelleri]